MKIFGLAGWSGSGKTVLLTRLIPALVGRGVSVSTVKHAHHAFDVDQPGKDSYRHREAGAREVLVASARRWALMHELEGVQGVEAEPDLETLLQRMSPVDLVLVEGFKGARIDKLEVHRAALGKPLLAATDPGIVAIAATGAPPASPLPTFDADEIETIAGFILGHLGLARPAEPPRAAPAPGSMS